MKIFALVCLVTLSLAVSAQQAQPIPTPEQAALNMCRNQRNGNADTALDASAAIAQLQKQLADANAELAKLKPKDEKK